MTCLAVWAPIRSAISAGAIATPSRCLDGAAGAIDLDNDVRLLPVVLLSGGNQRRFDPLEDNLFVDILVAMDRVNDSQQFVGVHSS